MRPLSLQDNPLIIRPGVIPVTPVSSYQLPRTFNAEDAENYAEVFSLLFSASSALLFASSALKVLRESSGCIDDDFALTGPSRTGTPPILTDLRTES